MNSDRESKSEEKQSGGGGGGGGEGEEGDSNRKKNNKYSLIFELMLLDKKNSSSWLKWFASFNTNKRSNGQVRGITLPMFYENQSNVILSWILNNLLNSGS